VLLTLKGFPFVTELAAGGLAVEFPVDVDAVMVHPPIPGSRFSAQDRLLNAINRPPPF